MADSIPKLVDPWLPDADPIPLSRPSIPVVVSKYDPDNESTPFTILTNVVVQSISWRISSAPPTARFRYIFGTGDTDAPQSFEQALNDSFTLTRLVDVDDRIVVHAQKPTDGTWVPIFYGYALGFHLALNPRTEAVYFDAVGAVRDAFNNPISGSLWRDGHRVNDTDADDIQTDIPGHFNPGGKGNCLPDTGWDKEADFNAFPVFLDTTNGFVDTWDLSRAVRYLIYSEMEKHPIDDIEVPEGNYLDALLVAKEPKPDVTFDPDDPTTYTVKGIEVADKPFDAKPWPPTVERIIGDKSLAFAWELNAVDGDLTLPKPRHFLSLFRPQSGKDGHGQPNPPKQVWLQDRGENLDLAYTNMGSANVTRDVTEVVNEWDVIGELEEFEISVILSPGFPMTMGAPANIDVYSKKNIQTSAGTNYNAFRLWLADESGEGHYHNGSTTELYDPLDLDDVLGAPIDNHDGTFTRQYVYRRRPTLADLLTIATDSKASYKAKLSFSTDYDVNGMQTLTPSGTLTAGTFTLTLGANTTTSLNYNATAGAITAALGALASVGSGNVFCSGGPINVAPVYVFFVGDKASTTMPNITVTASGLTGGGIGRSTQLQGGNATAPGLWDGTGTWTTIKGGFHLLKDRIGVYVSVENPNQWTVAAPNQVLKAVESLVNPNNVNKPFWLRLTCVIRGDKRVRGTAEKSLVDNLLHATVKRTVEARDRYFKRTVCKCSEYVSDATDHVIRDDTDAAQAEAVAMQQATEGGILQGPITIPRFTAYYRLGDRIEKINGRSLTFRTDNRGDAEPIYPIVEGITWNLDGNQSTTLHLSDANMARRSYASKIRPASGGRHR